MKWDAPAPKEREAGERSWDVVRSAWESRTAHPRRRRHRGALIAIAAGLAVIAAILSPPGMAVLSSIRDAVRGEKNAKSALFSLPSPGKVLVVSQRGAWIASADGSRRLLGNFADASWSPHGRFVVASRSTEISALDPKGNVRWSLERDGVVRDYTQARLMSFLDPWKSASGSGFQAAQAQIAIGSGGFFGRGLGESVQKIFYLPRAPCSGDRRRYRIRAFCNGRATDAKCSSSPATSSRYYAAGKRSSFSSRASLQPHSAPARTRLRRSAGAAVRAKSCSAVESCSGEPASSGSWRGPPTAAGCSSPGLPPISGSSSE